MLVIDDDALEDPDYDSDYYDDDIFEDDYSFMQDQFDNADLPPGVEASLPWLKDIGSSDCKQAAAHFLKVYILPPHWVIIAMEMHA
jgi:ubiquitin-conjugating enzyme E2 O